MSEPIRYESIQEPLDDEERELMDTDTWDWDAIEEGITVGEPGTILTMELSRDEHRTLAQAASAEGLTTHAFIKRSALAAASANRSHPQQPANAPRAGTG